MNRIYAGIRFTIRTLSWGLQSSKTKRNCSLRLATNMALSEKKLQNACHPPDPETKGYSYQYTMLRIKDPEKSIRFYTEVLGMTLVYKYDFPEAKFSIYFMSYADEAVIPKEKKERIRWCFSNNVALELTHNWGTEEKDGLVYHNGNTEPRGFGHIGIVVPSVYKACERFEKMEVTFQKKPDQGKIKGLAFIKDPDGYCIEIFDHEAAVKLDGAKFDMSS